MIQYISVIITVLRYVETGGGSEESLLGILCAGCRPVIQILTLFQTKKCHFSHSFSDLTSKKICHHYLDWNTNKNDFLICKFLVLSYSFGIETINAFIYTPVVPSKTIPDSRPK